MLCEIFKEKENPPFVASCPKILCSQKRLFRALGVKSTAKKFRGVGCLIGLGAIFSGDSDSLVCDVD